MFALVDGLKKREQLEAEGFKCTPISVSYFPTLVDGYAFTTSAMVLPLSICVWCVITVISFWPATLGFIYLHFQPRPINRLEGFWFNFYCILAFPAAALVYLIAYLWFGVVLFLAFAFGLPIAIFRLIFQPGVIQNNFRILAPYWRSGAFNYPDSVRCHLGQADRHGFLAFLLGSPFLGGYASSICHTPILKYFWSTNPFFYELEVVELNQWTPPIPDLTPHQVRHRTQTKVGRSKHRKGFKQELNTQRFTPHYPFSQSLGVDDMLEHKECVVGSQYLNCHPKLYGHTRSEWARATDAMDSKTGLLPVFRVYLDFFAYHFLTGYVELNVSKEGGVEHPMWCVVPKYGKLGRDLYQFANILFVPYLKESLYATTILRDDDERDVMMKALAKRRKSLIVVDSETNNTGAEGSQSPTHPDKQERRKSLKDLAVQVMNPRDSQA